MKPPLVPGRPPADQFVRFVLLYTVLHPSSVIVSDIRGLLEETSFVLKSSRHSRFSLERAAFVGRCTLRDTSTLPNVAYFSSCYFAQGDAPLYWNSPQVQRGPLHPLLEQ